LPKRSKSLESTEADFNMDLENDSPPQNQRSTRVRRSGLVDFFFD
jgi:hypothetical protein